MANPTGVFTLVKNVERRGSMKRPEDPRLAINLPISWLCVDSSESRAARFPFFQRPLLGLVRHDAYPRRDVSLDPFDKSIFLINWRISDTFEW